MRLSIMQPYIFPYIGYFHLIRDVDLFVVYDDVNFIKKGWINRNRILLNHSDHRFTLNLRQVSQFRKINELGIGDNRAELVKTFSQAYAKAPYFKEVMPLVEELLMHDTPQLALYLRYQLESISRYIGIKTKFVMSSDVPKDNSLTGQDKLIAMCKQLGATSYSNAIGGQSLYSEEDFAEHGIDLKFIKSHRVDYKQFGREFVPWLSIVDVLMFNSKEEISSMLDAYERVSAVIELAA